jgi:hypothetical protein
MRLEVMGWNKKALAGRAVKVPEIGTCDEGLGPYYLRW